MQSPCPDSSERGIELSPKRGAVRRRVLRASGVENDPGLEPAGDTSRRSRRFVAGRRSSPAARWHASRRRAYPGTTAEGGSSLILKSRRIRRASVVAASLVWPVGCLLSIDEGSVDALPDEGGVSDVSVRDDAVPAPDAPGPRPRPGSLDVSLGGASARGRRGGQAADDASCLTIDDDGRTASAEGSGPRSSAGSTKTDVRHRLGNEGTEHPARQRLRFVSARRERWLLLYQYGTMVRLLPSGQLDRDFGDGGLATHDPRGFPYSGKNVAHRRGERWSLTVGAVHTDAGMGPFLARFSDTGALTASNVRTARLASNVLLRPDGTSWTVGSDVSGDVRLVELARYGTNLELGPVYVTELVPGTIDGAPRAPARTTDKLVLVASLGTGAKCSASTTAGATARSATRAACPSTWAAKGRRSTWRCRPTGRSSSRGPREPRRRRATASCCSV